MTAAEQVHGKYNKDSAAVVISLDRTVIGGITEVPCGPPTIEVVDSLLCCPPSVEILCVTAVLCTKKLVEVLRVFAEIYLVRCLDAVRIIQVDGLRQRSYV